MSAKRHTVPRVPASTGPCRNSDSRSIRLQGPVQARKQGNLGGQFGQARSFRLGHRYGPVALLVMEAHRSAICGRDYESFTGSCLPADMNPGGRTPRSWASCANHDHGTTPR